MKIKTNSLILSMSAALFFTIPSSMMAGGTPGKKKSSHKKNHAQVIPAVTIGKDTWMAKNLDVDKFNNGDRIRMVTNDAEWTDAGKKGEPVWCYPGYNPENGATYGKLYNYFAIADQRGIAPNGWFIPTDSDWSRLLTAAGPNAIPKLKSASGWQHDQANNNQTGFSALPAGYHSGYLGKFAYFWTATAVGKDRAKIVILIPASDVAKREAYPMTNGYSVRCIKIQEFVEEGRTP
jgi:uncharacterized protein (TIGR02145 family)